MASRKILSSCFCQMNTIRAGSSKCGLLYKIGCREIVGFGFNGEPNYIDRIDFPFPAIRYKEANAEIQALKEKEKGDWRKLSKGEKKSLYRASFGLTFAEMKAPTGEWKGALGLGLVGVALGIWMFIAVKIFVYKRGYPGSFTDEAREAQLKRMIIIGINPVLGISSKWDYEKDDWKK